MKSLLVPAGVVAFLCALANQAMGQERLQFPERTFAFPEAPQQWINSNPLTVEQLKGKAVFLWFFEEDCPRCREKWPGLLSLAQRYADDPVLFVAVNSGTPRGELEAYVRACRITWPVIVDPTRELEQAAGLDEISLQNIHQAKVVMPDGSLVAGNWSDVEGTVDSAIRTAAWKVSPKEIPALLRPAWNEIELGNYAAAAATIRKSLNSPRDDVKSGAEKLHEVVVKERDGQLAAAKEALDAGEKWQAYRVYTEASEKFKGYELPDDLEKTRKTLAGEPEVKEELAAFRQYETAVKQLTSAAAQQRRRGLATLERIVKEKPETEAAKKAQAAIDKAGSQ